MSSDIALQAMFDRFMERFVLPLVDGGGVLASYPLAPGALQYFREAVPADPHIESKIIRARQEVLAELVPSPLPLDLTPQDIDLLAALHNVLLCSHQELVEGFRGSKRWNHCIGWAREHLARVAPCPRASAALARHSLLHQTTTLTRVDSVVKTRRSTSRYLGQEPPPRALIWPRFRRLKQTQEVADFQQVIADEEARGVLTAILELSPLTCLLDMPYALIDPVHSADFRWSQEVLTVLTRADLCRSVTYAHQELGLALVGPHLAHALLSELGSAADVAKEPRLVFGLRYLLNLQLTHCWTADADDVTKVVEEDWGEQHAETQKYFFGWFAAALAREDRLGAPPPANADLQARETRYRIAAAAAAGPALEYSSRHVDMLVPPWTTPQQESKAHG